MGFLGLPISLATFRGHNHIYPYTRQSGGYLVAKWGIFVSQAHFDSSK